MMLLDNPHTRDSDALLILEIYRMHYHLPDPVNHKKLMEIMAYESPDDIVRARRWFQSPKTNPEEYHRYKATQVVEDARLDNIEASREALGYRNINHF